MSQVRPDIDLGALARKETPIQPPRRSALRILVPAVILLTFAGLLASTLGDLWRGTVEVELGDVVDPRRGEPLGGGLQLEQAGEFVHEVGEGHGPDVQRQLAGFDARQMRLHHFTRRQLAGANGGGTLAEQLGRPFRVLINNELLKVPEMAPYSPQARRLQ